MREFTSPPLAAAPPHSGGLADAVYDHAEAAPDRVALGRKDAEGHWQDVTSAEFRDQVLALAKGLLAEGLRFGDRVAIMSRTRYEWTLFDFALWSIGVQSVPVYSTSSAEQIWWMLYDAEVVACVVEHEDHAMSVGSVIDRLPLLKRLWQLDAGAVDELVAAGAGIEDAAVHRNRAAVRPDGIATIIYTSGTTGRPKGCVITHGNFMYEADTVIHRWEPVFHSRPGDQASTLLFLPLAHVFGRMVEIAAIRGRVKLGHQPELRASALLPDLVAFRPSFILAVPYIFEKVYSAARRKAERDGKLGPFEKAIDVAVRYAEAMEHRAFSIGPGPSASLRVQHQFFEKAVYSKVRAAMGGRVRHAFSGGSAMDRRLGLFFEGAGVTVFEGYGLTESCAAATVNPPERARYGTVGQPIPGSSVYIAPDGEVWLHGGMVFSGYLGDPKASDAVLHDGWLATGDLGALDEDGYLTITGRKKEILVTSGGKSVSPTALEERVRAHPLVAQCIVVGNDRPYIAALVTVDQESVDHWLSVQGKPPLKSADLVRDPDLEMEVRRAVVAANTAVSQAESIRTFRILAHPFSEEHGLLTPSLKLKRKAIEAAYTREVEALYR
ncbi:long-chain fatty acid--CoA ligase [Streptomyces sp. AcH 505]|uniref:AMP-dependent synthetase/ligase n=1 Tax=Streptomyces sp. AcH 505 TaxID=352211 RepID=UPI0005922554|nr:long-chain fatty acid--CoA ligase [Streptomyces sp. AcH 505]